MTTPTIPKRFSGCRGGSDAPRPQNHGGLRDDLRAAQLGPVADSSSVVVRDVVQRCLKSIQKLIYPGKKGDKGDLT